MPKLIGVGVVGVHVCRFPNASAHIKSRTLPTMPTRGRTIINFQTIKHKERWFLGPRRETDTPMTLNKFFLFLARRRVVFAFGILGARGRSESGNWWCQGGCREVTHFHCPWHACRSTAERTHGISTYLVTLYRKTPLIPTSLPIQNIRLSIRPIPKGTG